MRIENDGGAEELEDLLPKLKQTKTKRINQFPIPATNIGDFFPFSLFSLFVPTATKIYL